MSGMEPVAAAALVPEIGALLAPAVAAAAPAAAAATGAGALGAGALGAGALGAGGSAAGLLATPAATGAMAYVTPSLAPSLSGVLSGTAMEYGTPAMLAEAGAAASAAPAPGLLAQAGGYLKDAGKAASAYDAVSGGMGGQQQGMPPPAPRAVFEGQPPAPITQEQPQRNDHEFAQMLLEQRKRGMLG